MVSEAVNLLKGMIAIPSITFEEERVADFLYNWLKKKDSFDLLRIKNNILALPRSYTADKPTLMLNAHIDTVKAAESYTIDPYAALEKDGAIFGLGSNDDGGCVVSLIEAFLYANSNRSIAGAPQEVLTKESINNINVVLLLSAEEERSGTGGISYAMEVIGNNKIPEVDISLPDGFKIDFAIVLLSFSCTKSKPFWIALVNFSIIS